MKSAIIEAAEYIESELNILSMRPSAKRRKLVKLALRLRAEAQRPAVPKGWNLVPVEPTDEMCRELHGIYGEARRRWSAALEVAPTPPASEDSPSVEKSSVIRAPQRGGR